MADKYISTAKVIDGVLILSLPDAVTPVVWQMELGQSKSSALEIRNTENGHFLLALKTPRQDVLEIATYADRDQAIKALLVVSQAMEKAQGQLKTAAANSYPVPALSSRYNGDATTAIIDLLISILKFSAKLMAALFLIVLVLFMAGKLFSSNPTSTGTISSSGNAPVSADEFLEGR